MRTISIQGANVYQEKHNGGKRWVVFLGRKFTRSKPTKRRFKSYDEAKRWLLAEVERQKKQGASGYVLTSSQIEQAARAFAVLAGRATLAEAVEDFVKRKFPREGTKTLAEAVKSWLAKKKEQGRSAVYLATVTDIYDATAKAFSGNLNEIESQHLEKWLANKRKDSGDLISNNTFNHYARDLKALWNYAIQQGWAAHNPASEIELRTEVAPDIGILTPMQALAVLRAAADEPGCPALAFLVLALFAGVRTEELRRLTWDGVILDDEPRVIVRGKGAKGQQEGRVIDLTPNAVAWLLTVPFRHGRIGNPNTRRLARLRRAAGAWPKNGARHSFVSYKARFAGEVVASEAAGHESLRVTRKRYKKLVSLRAAKAWFSITPATTAEQLTAALAQLPSSSTTPGDEKQSQQSA